MINKLTQYQKIVSLMISRRGLQEWFYPYDFMKTELGKLFVGYKAPTRIAELHLQFPEMFEKRIEGKYMVRRFRFENVDILLKTLPTDWIIFLKEELNRTGVSYKIISKIPILNPKTNAVHFEEKEVEGNPRLKL